MTTFAMPYLHPGQTAVMEHPARFKALAAGRRWGKTMLGALSCVAVALQGGRSWWVAPTYGIAGIGWRVVVELAEQIPGATIKSGERTAYFPSGGWVRVKSAKDPDSLRGEGLDHVVLDEAAYIVERVWTEVIRPALADRKGSALLISTPNGHNWFYERWQMGNRGEGLWWSRHFATIDSPFIDQEEVDDARSQLPPIVFSQEFEAAFTSDSGVVFRRIMDALYFKSYVCVKCEQLNELFGQLTCKHCSALIEPEGLEYVTIGDEVPRPEDVVYIGTDWGQKHDFTVNTAMRSDFTVVDIDRYNKVSWSIQRSRLLQMHRKWNNATILAEANSIGWPNIEALQEEGVPVEGFETTLKSKTRIVHQGVLAFEEQRVRIPYFPVLIDELYAFSARQLLTGWRYEAPSGQHDDTVISFLLALEATTLGRHVPLVMGPVHLRSVNPTRMTFTNGRAVPMRQMQRKRAHGRRITRSKPR